MDEDNSHYRYITTVINGFAVNHAAILRKKKCNFENKATLPAIIFSYFEMTAIILKKDSYIEKRSLF